MTIHPQSAEALRGFSASNRSGRSRSSPTRTGPRSLQQPRGDDPDEVTFVIMGQVMELQFKPLGYELTRFKVWRYRHFVTVERLIGFKPGTGGSGIGWLRKVVDQNFFPELWEIRTEL